MRYSLLILSAMLIMTFTACNKGGKENDIAHETPISEETTITIGSTETTSTAKTQEIATTIQAQTTNLSQATTEIFINPEPIPIRTKGWSELFGVPDPFDGKFDDDQSHFFELVELKFHHYFPWDDMTEYFRMEEFHNTKEFLRFSQADTTSLMDYLNPFSVIIKYDVPNDVVAKSLKEYNKKLSKDSSAYFTEEEISAILSRDAATVLRYFAPEEAIVIRDRVYTPAWVYTHKIEDYVAAGITPAMIEEKLELYAQFAFRRKSYAEAFEAKLSEFLGREVLLNWKYPQIP